MCFHIPRVFVIVLISKRGYLKTTENKSSCQPGWVAYKKNDLTEKSCPNRLGLELKRIQGMISNIEVAIEFLRIFD